MRLEETSELNKTVCCATDELQESPSRVNTSGGITGVFLMQLVCPLVQATLGGVLHSGEKLEGPIDTAITPTNVVPYMEGWPKIDCVLLRVRVRAHVAVRAQVRVRVCV